MVNNKGQKNFILSILLILLFCYPIFSIFNKKIFVGNTPLLFLYITIVWLLALVLLIISAEAKPLHKKNRNKDE